MKHTVDDKLKYNKEQKTAFSWGYVLGVKAYRGYPKATAAVKQRIKDEMDYNKQLAATGNASRQSVKAAKGYMCGVRDAANERKEKQRN